MAGPTLFHPQHQRHAQQVATTTRMPRRAPRTAKTIVSVFPPPPLDCCWLGSGDGEGEGEGKGGWDEPVLICGTNGIGEGLSTGSTVTMAGEGEGDGEGGGKGEGEGDGEGDGEGLVEGP